MDLELPATEKPYGPNCGDCELFTDGQCLGVSTVRIVIGTAQKVERSLHQGNLVDLSPMWQAPVGRSFRVLQKRMAECPGVGSDGDGDFRRSHDRLSGYVSASIIRTALAQLKIPSSKQTKQLSSISSSFMPSEGRSSLATLRQRL